MIYYPMILVKEINLKKEAGGKICLDGLATFLGKGYLFNRDVNEFGMTTTFKAYRNLTKEEKIEHLKEESSKLKGRIKEIDEAMVEVAK